MNIKQKLSQLTDNGDKKKVILLLTLAGILLIAASYFENISNEETNIKRNTVQNDISEYEENIREQTKALIENIDNIKDVNVIMTFKSTGEKMLQYDSENSNSSRTSKDTNESDSNSKRTTVIMQNNGEEKPYVIKETYPQVAGIAVTAKGVNKSGKKDEIINMLSALFDVPLHKISIIDKK